MSKLQVQLHIETKELKEDELKRWVAEVKLAAGLDGFLGFMELGSYPIHTAVSFESEQHATTLAFNKLTDALRDAMSAR